MELQFASAKRPGPLRLAVNASPFPRPNWGLEDWHLQNSLQQHHLQHRHAAISSPASGYTGVCSSLEEAMQHQMTLQALQESDSSPGPFPERPGEPDCTHYILTGLCSFGMSCRYNHPPDRKLAAAFARDKGEYPERIGQPECQYYLKTGTCKFGSTCKFHHPREIIGFVSRVPLNILGFPLRLRNSRWLEIQDGTTQETLCGAGPWNHSWVDLMPPSLKQGDTHPDHGVQAAISSSYQNGELSKVHELVQHSKQEVCIDNHVLFHMLQTCTDRKDVAAGKRAYYFTVESGLESDALLGNQLIRMFEAFEKLSEAKQVFSKLLAPDTLSWSAIISAHCKLGQREQAMSLYFDMHNLRIPPDGYVFVAILKACTTMAHGKLIHAHVIESGLESHVFVCNTLIAMYIRCGNLDNAIVVFSRLPERDVVSWSALISGYTQYDFGEKALELFQQMDMDGMVPNPFTFSCILKACSSIADIEHGLQIHSCIIENGFELDIFIANTLIDMYCKCHRLDIACNVFERLPNRDVATWNAMITGYGQVGHGQEALQLLQQMQRDGIQPDKVTFICSLKACSSSAALEQGEEIHAHLIACGFESDIVVGNILIDMYGRCGSLHYALLVFHRMPERDVITWSGLITGYALHGLGQEALQLFYRMGSNGLEPNWVTFVCLLKACASTEDFGQDNHIHALIVKAGFGETVFVGSGLIDLYGKHGNLHSARMVFDRLPRRDVGTWNSMISVYIQQGLVQTAIQLFWQMQQEDMEPDQITIVSILKACSSIVAFEQGLQVHCFICGIGLESDLFVGNTLIDMYSKCGSLDDANIMFGRLPKRDVITWNAMIAGFAQNCNYMLAAQCFRDMQQGGLKPDEVTFLCLLSACGHVGLVSEGCIHFKSMIEDHGIMPMLEHLNSMIDILGHASLFSEAEDLLESIPFQFNLAGWTSLLCSCRTHCNVNLGKQCFDQVMRIDPGFAPGYVLMSNMYAHAGMWEDAERIQNLKRFVNTWKKPAKAFIEINKQVHQFTVGDKTHPCSNMIYAKLKALNMQLKAEGYILQQQQLFVHLPPDEDKEDALCGHCERLAIAFGLVSTSEGTTIRIAKNLRVCADCHNATKMISKVERRDIILIDAYCVHHFKEGGCSCRNFS